MTRFFKILSVTGLASIYLMQAPCTFAGHGFSIIPNIGKVLNVGALLGLGT